jgi:hypothetical protein
MTQPLRNRWMQTRHRRLIKVVAVARLTPVAWNTRNLCLLGGGDGADVDSFLTMFVATVLPLKSPVSQGCLVLLQLLLGVWWNMTTHSSRQQQRSSTVDAVVSEVPDRLSGCDKLYVLQQQNCPDGVSEASIRFSLMFRQ